MDYVNLGRTGLKVSRICLGCMSYGSRERGAQKWVLDEEASRPFFRQALEAGINFFDTANVYSLGASEEITGRALKDFARRDEVVIATKVHGKMRDDPNGRGLSRKAIMQRDRRQPEAARHRLCRPLPDPSLGLPDADRGDDRGAARRGEGRQGPLYRRLLDVGVAVHAGAGAAARRTAGRRFVSMQNHYNLLYREEEREMLPLCRAEGIGVIPWSPLARGTAGAAVGDAADDRARRIRSIRQESLQPHAGRGPRHRRPRARDRQSRGLPAAQVALAWMLAKPGITAPIVGATKPNHLADAIAALSIKLSNEEIAKLEEPYAPHPVAGFT